MTTNRATSLDSDFEQLLGYSFEALLAPLSGVQPTGAALRGSPLYAAIQDARHEDDVTLPQGPWERELQRADWASVERLTLQALHAESKDLQLVVWLLEARIHRVGFAGVAPVLYLAAELLQRYGLTLHPQARDGDASHCANILRWINSRLLAPLKLSPITEQANPGVLGREITWADREYAQRLEQHRVATRGDAAPASSLAQTGVVDMAAVSAALAATPDRACAALRQDLVQALDASAALAAAIDLTFVEDPPGLGAFTSVLQDAHDWIAAELKRRGLPLTAQALSPPVRANSPPAELAAALPAPVGAGDSTVNRAQAYAMLASAADLLRQVEPHSPVPYVVQRAIAWGALNTAELYQELFIRQGGQISIFELLGLAAAETEEAAS